MIAAIIVCSVNLKFDTNIEYLYKTMKLFDNVNRYDTYKIHFEEKTDNINYETIINKCELSDTPYVLAEIDELLIKINYINYKNGIKTKDVEYIDYLMNIEYLYHYLDNMTQENIDKIKCYELLRII